MKKQILLTVILLMCGFVFPKIQATLHDVMNPHHLVVDGDRFYVSEKSTVAVYSTKDFAFIKRFGRRGEGPGEFKSIPSIKKQRDFLSITCLGKYLTYSLNGELIKEQRLPSPFTLYCQTAGRNLIGLAAKPVGKRIEMAITLFDSNFKPIKKLAVKNSNSSKRYQEALWDYFRHIVYKDRIYVGNTRYGFFIEVFDHAGKKLYDINKKNEQVEVTEEYKKKFLERMKNSPMEKMAAKASGGKLDYTFRKYF
ncbi:MAG: 6-bladed beta-propeller, partial [bacterium]|nr:6-bladed beta-propeller [bacterium]